MSTDETTERAYAALIPPRVRLEAALGRRGRYAGRAALERMVVASLDRDAEDSPARRTALAALAALEATPVDRERRLLRGEYPPDVALALAMPKSIRDLRDRRAAIARVTDSLAAREPGNVRRRTARRALDRALREARFRTATHSHGTAITLVALGEECAVATAGQARPSAVGLPNAYAKRGFWVATSFHKWRLCPEAFLRVPAADRAGPGWVRLSDYVLVSQGRGTGLTTEIRPRTLAAKRALRAVEAIECWTRMLARPVLRRAGGAS